MPISRDRYKAKNCQWCGIIHRKRGKFCSLKCANSRSPTEKTRKERSEALREYYTTLEGDAFRRMHSDNAKARHRRENAERMGLPVLTDEDWLLDIPLTTENLDDIYDDDSDIWR